MRSFLTTLGIVIGVAAVITMVTLGNGATRMVSDQIASLGSNLLMVMPGQRFGPGRDSPGAPNFKLADVEAIQRRSTASRRWRRWSAAGDAGRTAARTGPPGHRHEQRLLRGRQLEDRRRPQFSETRKRAGKAVCVIGETVRASCSATRTRSAASSASSTSPARSSACWQAKGQSSMGSGPGRRGADAAAHRAAPADRQSGRFDTVMLSVRDGANPIER
jgi:putative ABC transport system permease protein